jgi:hypothetical protein
MIKFEKDFHENFLAVVRKYMQLRKVPTQKDLSEITGIGLATLSRFFNHKTMTIDEQLVARIIAGIDLPLNEIVDWVTEDSVKPLKKLIEYYKDQEKSRDIDEVIMEKMSSLSLKHQQYLLDFFLLDKTAMDLVMDQGDTILLYLNKKK